MAVAVTVLAALFTGCSEDDDDPVLNSLITYTIKSDESYKVSNGVITLTPSFEGAEYEFSGAFSGQIVNKVKDTKIKLNNFAIKNTKARAAIYCEADTEISAAENSSNVIQTSGDPAAEGEEQAAIQGVDSADIELGGSGKITYISGLSKHGVKADTVKMKGSGKFIITANEDGSGISCNEFIVKEGKTFLCVIYKCKNGIKADNYIEVASGEFRFSEVKTAFKTDKKKDDGKEDHHITLNNNQNRYYAVEKPTSSDTVTDNSAGEEDSNPLEDL